MTSPLPPAVVLDLSPNGLGIVRSLAARGIQVTAADMAWKVRMGRTRFASCRVCPDPAVEPEAAVSFLTDLAAELGARPVLYVGSDDFVQLLSQHRERLSPHYRFLLPPEAAVEQVLDKRQTHRLAQRHGIPAPRTWLVEGAAQTIEDVQHEITFPCIIKPARSYRFRRSVNQKAFLIHGRGQLLDQYRSLQQHGPLLVQEFIPGGDSQIFQAGYCFDIDGELVGRFMGRKLLQHPPTFGSAALAVAETREQVLELGAGWFQAMECRGLCNVEFKLDPRDGQLKLMEPDLRLWLWHDLSRPCGIDLAYLYYEVLTGQDPAPRLQQRNGIKWVYGVRAVKSALHYYRQGTLSARELGHMFQGPRHHALFRLDDPLPWLRLTAAQLRS